MTPEQERLLHVVAGGVERIDERTEAFKRWSEAHEEADAEARKDLDSLLETRVKTKTTARVLMAVGVGVSTVVGWLVGLASAQ